MNEEEIFYQIMGGFMGFAITWMNGPEKNMARQFVCFFIGIGLGVYNWRWMPYLAFAMYPSQQLLRQSRRMSRY